MDRAVLLDFDEQIRTRVFEHERPYFDSNPKPILVESEGQLEDNISLLSWYTKDKFVKRIYKVPQIHPDEFYGIFSSNWRDCMFPPNTKFPFNVPDFEQLEIEFFSNIDAITKLTMIWAIYYSKLNNYQKINRLKKYYHPDNFKPFIKICKRLKAVELLEWMKGEAK